MCKATNLLFYKKLSIVRPERCSGNKMMFVRRHLTLCLKHTDDEALRYYGVEKCL